MSKKVETETHKIDGDRKQGVNHHMNVAGDICRPHNHNLIGLSAIFFYEAATNDPITGKYRAAVVTQINLKDVPEEFADMGYKQLLDKMMSSYGRKPKRSRNG